MFRRIFVIIFGICFVIFGLVFIGLAVGLILDDPTKLSKRDFVFAIAVMALVGLVCFAIAFRSFKRTQKNNGDPRCAACGCSTNLTNIFREQPRLLQRAITYCPLCWNKKHSKKYSASYILWFLWGTLGLILLFAGHHKIWASICINLFLLQTFEVLCIVPHELAHAFIAKKLGMRVFRISIGTGRIVLIRRFFGFETEFRSLPFMGWVQAAYPGGSYSRGKHLMFNAAGPAINFLLALVTYLVVKEDALKPVWLHRVSPIHVLMYTNLLILAANLLPRQITTPLGIIGSDGQQIIELLRNKKVDAHQHDASWLLMEGMTHYEKKDYSQARSWFEKALERYPNHIQLQWYLALVLTKQHEFQKARDLYVNLLSSTKDSLNRSIFMNNIAHITILAEFSAELEEADHYSGEAMKTISWMPEIKGTRGAVLMVLGRLEEARQLLQESLKYQDPSNHEARKQILSFLAIAEFKRGDIIEAHRYLNEARNLDPDNFLLKRAENFAGRS